MIIFIEFLAMTILVIVFYQFYGFTVSRKGVEKQKKCQQLGIFYTTLGTLLLVYREVAAVITGLILIMMGLRLIAHGLDRLDKKIYIDHYADDDADASVDGKEGALTEEKKPVPAPGKAFHLSRHAPTDLSETYTAR